MSRDSHVMPDSPSIESSEPKFDAFLSYSSADRPVVRRIQRFLESYRPPNRSRCLRVYLDETDMRGGSLPENLSTALADSRALVVCWSDKAARSAWVKAEISKFRDRGQESRIAVVHVAGAGPTIKHEVFTGLEPVEHDVRNAWRAWFLTPKAKLELLRLIAFLTNVEMRLLRNWARRRVLRNSLLAFAVATLPLGAVLSVHLPHWDPVALSSNDQPIEPLACEVVNGKLWVASWSEVAGEVSGARAYFVTYPDVLTEPGKPRPRPQFFVLPKRALPEPMVSQDLVRHVRSVLDTNGVTGQLEGLSPKEVPRIVQPRPDRFVFIQPIARGEANEQDLRWAAMDRLPVPETSGALVVVHENGSSPRVSAVSDLSPPLWKERTADNQRRTSPARGMSLVWQKNGEIWIGVPGERGIAGGLWHSSDSGKSWQKVDGFFSVTSLDLRAAPYGGKETLMVAEQSFKRLSGTEFIQGSSRVVERASDGTWIRSDAPPYGADSDIEICGTLPDGTPYVRVDNQVYQQRSRPLYRSVIDVFGTSNP